MNPDTVAHLSTNRARRRLTSLSLSKIFMYCLRLQGRCVATEGRSEVVFMVSVLRAAARPSIMTMIKSVVMVTPCVRAFTARRWTAVRRTSSWTVTTAAWWIPPTARWPLTTPPLISAATEWSRREPRRTRCAAVMQSTTLLPTSAATTLPSVRRAVARQRSVVRRRKTGSAAVKARSTTRRRRSAVTMSYVARCSVTRLRAVERLAMTQCRHSAVTEPSTSPLTNSSAVDYSSW